MRRALAVAITTAAMLAATASVAIAVPQPIVGQATNTFSAASYELAGGAVATMTSSGGTHNATSTTGVPGALFKSADIPAGGSGPVNGTEFLPAGSYPFTCTLHAGMNSTLVVSGGAPLVKPTATITILSKGLDKVASSGKLKVGVESTAATVELTAKLGAKTLATATGAPGTTNLKLTRGGRKSLAKKNQARISVTGTPAFGDPVTVARKLK